MKKLSKKVQTTLRLPVDLKDKLDKDALTYGVSLNEYIILLIYKSYQSLLE